MATGAPSGRSRAVSPSGSSTPSITNPRSKRELPTPWSIGTGTKASRRPRHPPPLSSSPSRSPSPTSANTTAGPTTGPGQHRPIQFKGAVFSPNCRFARCSEQLKVTPAAGDRHGWASGPACHLCASSLDVLYIRSIPLSLAPVAACRVDPVLWARERLKVALAAMAGLRSSGCPAALRCSRSPRARSARPPRRPGPWHTPRLMQAGLACR